MSSQAFFGTPHCVSLSLTLAKPLDSERSLLIRDDLVPKGLTTALDAAEATLVPGLPLIVVMGTMAVTAILERLAPSCLPSVFIA